MYFLLNYQSSGIIFCNVMIMAISISVMFVSGVAVMNSFLNVLSACSSPVGWTQRHGLLSTDAAKTPLVHAFVSS